METTPMKLEKCPYNCQASSPGSSNQKQARLTVLDEETKDALLQMSKPSDMDPAERKRQYSAMLLCLLIM